MWSEQKGTPAALGESYLSTFNVNQKSTPFYFEDSVTATYILP